MHVEYEMTALEAGAPPSQERRFRYATREEAEAAQAIAEAFGFTVGVRAVAARGFKRALVKV